MTEMAVFLNATGAKCQFDSISLDHTRASSTKTLHPAPPHNPMFPQEKKILNTDNPAHSLFLVFAS